MQAKDIKPRTWYALTEKYRMPDLVMLPGIGRYTIDGTRTLLFTPDQPISGMGHWTRRTTSYLSVQLFGPAREAVQKWILDREGEDAARTVMNDAATLLTKVVGLVELRGKIQMSEVNQPENLDRGIIIKLVASRDIVGDYAQHVTVRRDNEEAARQRREAADQAKEQRRQVMVDILDRAAKVGVNTERFHGGAYSSHDAFGEYTKVEMSVETFVAMVTEIERLRAVVGETLRADETGEGGTGAGA